MCPTLVTLHSITRHCILVVVVVVKWSLSSKRAHTHVAHVVDAHPRCSLTGNVLLLCAGLYCRNFSGIQKHTKLLVATALIMYSATELKYKM